MVSGGEGKQQVHLLFLDDISQLFGSRNALCCYCSEVRKEFNELRKLAPRFQNSAYVTNGILVWLPFWVFILETLWVAGTNNAVLVAYGARANPADFIRPMVALITPVFLHIGLTHILMNGFSLYFLGQMTERLFGHWPFLL